MKTNTITIEKLRQLQLKLVECSSFVNESLSPLMIFTFAVSFALFCVFIFTIFIFPAEFWMKFKGFTVSLSLVNIHHILVLLTSVWACEATAKEQKELLDETFRVAIASDDSLLSEKVRKDLTKESLRETSNRN